MMTISRPNRPGHALSTSGWLRPAVLLLVMVAMFAGCPVGGLRNQEPSFGDGQLTIGPFVVGVPVTPVTLPAASGGDGELTYSLDPVPDGLEFDPATRALSGTPTTAGSVMVVYRVEDAAGAFAELSGTIVVNPAPLSFIIDGELTIGPFVAGMPVSPATLPAASGGSGELTYSLDPVPDGLAFDPATRVLSGTPTTAGSVMVVYRVEDAAGAFAELSGTIVVSPAPSLTPAHVGTWHIAGRADPTTLTFGEDTFTFTVGDGTSVIDPPVPIEPQEGMELPENVSTKLTVSGNLAVQNETGFKLTVPDDGVSIEFVEGFEAPLGLAVLFLTLLFQGLTEEPMTVEIDDAGTTMTITGLFSGLLTGQNPFLPLTACKDAPCEGG